MKALSAILAVVCGQIQIIFSILKVRLSLSRCRGPEIKTQNIRPKDRRCVKGFGDMLILSCETPRG
jgi:hypothetical protein